MFEDVIASAPPRNAAPASTAISVVDGVSLHQTGTFETSLTAFMTVDVRTLLFPMFEPMSSRSMCGHEKFSSRASTPSSWQALASAFQLPSSLSLPEPAMIDATRTFDGCAFLIRDRRPTHQSIGLSEMSSQFHDEWRTESGRAFIEIREEWASALLNFVFGPATFVTGWRPIVFVDDPAPAGLEGPEDVRVRLGRRRRREKERVLDPDAGEDDGKIGGHRVLP